MSKPFILTQLRSMANGLDPEDFDQKAVEQINAFLDIADAAFAHPQGAVPAPATAVSMQPEPEPEPEPAPVPSVTVPLPRFGGTVVNVAPEQPQPTASDVTLPVGAENGNG